jgi:hypothetical protein
MSRVAPLLLASLLSATAALAQGVPPSIPEGARVRVYSTGARGIMEYHGLRADTLALRSFDTRGDLLLPISTIQGLYVSRGARSRPAAAFRGLSIGFAIGGALGAATGLFGDAQATGFEAVSRSERVVIGAVAVGALGAAIGTVVGVSRPGERWERVDLQRLRVSAGARGGRSVGLSFAF